MEPKWFRKSGPVLPVLVNGSFDGVAHFSCASLGSWSMRCKAKILGPYCAVDAVAGEYPQTANLTAHWQELFLLTSAVFIIA